MPDLRASTPSHRRPKPGTGRADPGHWATGQKPIRIRALLGAHDIDAFVQQGSSEEVHELYEVLVRDDLV